MEDFKRKKLNLIVVLDNSGSMSLVHLYLLFSFFSSYFVISILTNHVSGMNEPFRSDYASGSKMAIANQVNSSYSAIL